MNRLIKAVKEKIKEENSAADSYEKLYDYAAEKLSNISYYSITMHEILDMLEIIIQDEKEHKNMLEIILAKIEQ